MDFNTLEKIWDQQALTGAAVPADAVIAGMKREAQHAQRRIRGGIVIAASLLVLGWVMVIVAHLIGLKHLTAIGLIGELVGSALYIAFLARAVSSVQAVRKEMEAMGGTLRESVAAALRTVELQMANARIAAVAIPVVVAICAWMFTAKYLTGELRGVGAVAGSIFFAVLGTAIGGAFWHRYRTRLVPRRAELRETLRALDAESPS